MLLQQGAIHEYCRDEHSQAENLHAESGSVIKTDPTTRLRECEGYLAAQNHTAELAKDVAMTVADNLRSEVEKLRDAAMHSSVDGKTSTPGESLLRQEKKRRRKTRRGRGQGRVTEFLT